MIRQLEIEDLSKENKDLVLQILINLSSQERFIDTFIELNVIYRISTVLLKIIGDEHIEYGGINPELLYFKKETDKLEVKHCKFKIKL